MIQSELVIRVLIEGAIGGAMTAAVAFLLSRFTRDIAGRAFLVILLFTAAGAYFGFAVMGQAGPLWLLIELAHIIGFGVMGLLGLRGSDARGLADLHDLADSRRSAYWIAAGWALHPVWDIALHYFGPGDTFAPWPYTVACGTFDLVVALYVILAYGLIGPRRMGFRDVAPAM
ncbi:MAG TPA: DUF6010 family protein [Pyrinomonadaceae bacterium]|nr:DUF6010 family protein [Pyrinomonadaceae bacterium]